MDRDISVAAAVIVDGGRILAAQRGHGELAGGWEFPGGKLEQGETAAEACVREVREELAVDICDLAPFVTLEYEYPSFHMHLETFTCRLASRDQRPVSREHLDLRWLGKDEIGSVAWLPADIQIANALQAYLSNGATDALGTP